MSILKPTLTLSQETSDSTDVAYYRLGEFAKFVEYKPNAEALIASKDIQIFELDTAYQTAQRRIDRFVNETVPNLKNQKLELEKQKNFKDLIINALDEGHKAEIKSKNRKIFKGTLIGVILGLLGGLLIGG